MKTSLKPADKKRNRSGKGTKGKAGRLQSGSISRIVGSPLDSQTAMLKRVGPSERQKIVKRIGRVRGNEYVQRLLEMMRRSPTMPADQTGQAQRQETDESSSAEEKESAAPEPLELSLEPAANDFQFNLHFHQGIGATAGTHTVNLSDQVGLEGFLQYKKWQFMVEASRNRGEFQRQWSYAFDGVQDQRSLGFLLGNQYFSLGWRSDWFESASFAELLGGEVADEERLSLMNQRLGNLILQSAWNNNENTHHQVRLTIGNDSAILGGDGGDSYRTAQVGIDYLLRRGQWALQAGAGLDLFTGYVDKDDPSKRMETEEGLFYDTSAEPFNQWSQGLIEVRLGGSYFIPMDDVIHEIGLSTAFGPDTEGIRNLTQNRMIHQGLLGGIPQVPLVDRGGRFKFDVSVSYKLHFDLH